jgi:hypothetical protein
MEYTRTWQHWLNRLQAIIGVMGTFLAALKEDTHRAFAWSLTVIVAVACSCASIPEGVQTNAAVQAEQIPKESWTSQIDDNISRMTKEGRDIFRFDTFGSEGFWGGKLRLHEAIAGKGNGGAGPGLTARQALQLGLKVDAGKVPSILAEALKGGHVSLDKPETTLELLRADSVIGVKGFFDGKQIRSIGITCAICHSTVDDSFAKGIGRRLDGWPNRDLDIGRIASLAPNLKPLADIVRADEQTIKKVLLSWGPGKYDAEFNQDGKAFRPDGKSAATLLPAAYGLAGVNLHTYTGWGSVTYWNAYVANTQMFGVGTFFDPRMNDSSHYPAARRTLSFNKRPRGEDKITSKLAALHFYQLGIPAPTPPKDSYDPAAAQRGQALFNGKARCASCHVPPLFVEPGWSMHTAEEIGIDNFQAARSPNKKFYRTTPLRGLFTRMKGGFYHDGRFPDLAAVVAHYDDHLKLSLTQDEKAALIEFLKSL